MKTKITRMIAAPLLAMGIIAGAGAVPAQAVTITGNCYVKKTNHGAYERWCWADYNWFEEVFQGKYDRYKLVDFWY